MINTSTNSGTKVQTPSLEVFIGTKDEAIMAQMRNAIAGTDRGGNAWAETDRTMLKKVSTNLTAAEKKLKLQPQDGDLKKSVQELNNYKNVLASHKKVLDTTKDLIKQNDRIYCVAVRNNVVEGMAIFDSRIEVIAGENRKYLFVETLLTAPQNLGIVVASPTPGVKGVGSAILEKCKSIYGAQDYDGIKLNSTSTAKIFYQKQDFRFPNEEGLEGVFSFPEKEDVKIILPTREMSA